MRNIARIRPFLSFNDAKKLIHVLSVYTGLPKGSLVKLQLIQNAAARVLMKLKKREHTTPVLMELHWLPVHQRIDYKILTLVYKALHNLTLLTFLIVCQDIFLIECYDPLVLDF